MRADGKVLHHRSNRAENEEALSDCSTRAIELDPDYAHAHAWRACMLGQSLGLRLVRGRQGRSFDEVVRECWRSALALDDNDCDVHRILAAINISRNDLTKARHHQRARARASIRTTTSSSSSRARF